MTYRVLMTCGAFEPGFRGGGPVRSMTRIVDTLPERVDAVLVTRDRDHGVPQPYPGLSGRWVPRDRTRIFYLDTRAPRHWLRLWRDLRGTRFDLLYVNSFFSPLFTLAPLLAARCRLVRAGRILIAPRGELSPGALSLKAAKKRLFVRLWGGAFRRAGVLWHASTVDEAAEIRAVYPWAQVRIGLNQTALPPEPLAPRPGTRTLRLVFVGRIAAKKNLLLVLEALRGVDAPAELDVFGPVEDRAYWSACERAIGSLGANVTVRYRGELPPAEVRGTFARYDVFVLPTLGENFGHVIAESLSASCPVVCSDRTPWSGVLRAGGGTVLHGGGAAELCTEIVRWAVLTPGERLRERERAGAAYREWRAGVSGANILDQLSEEQR